MEIVADIIDDIDYINEFTDVSYDIIGHLSFKVLYQLVSELTKGDGVCLINYCFIHVDAILDLLVG